MPQEEKAPYTEETFQKRRKELEEKDLFKTRGLEDRLEKVCHRWSARFGKEPSQMQMMEAMFGPTQALARALVKETLTVWAVHVETENTSSLAEDYNTWFQTIVDTELANVLSLYRPEGTEDPA